MFKILVAVDSSAPADRAIDAVAAMAKAAHAEFELILANVRELPIVVGDLPVFDMDELDRFLKHKQDEMLAAARSRAQGLGLKVVDTQATAGVVAPEIVAIAERCEADQIVMGSHGRGAVGSLFLGSVALRVLQLAKVPVLLVK